MISIVIPTLNEESYIGKLLGFLNEHPFRDQFEVFVVDGGSKDATLSIVQKYDFEVIQTKKASRAHQMNAGANKAKGEILYFVHADVKLPESFISDIKSAIKNGNHCGCYRFKFQNPRNPLLHINGFFTRFPFKWCRGGDQTFFITKDCFEKLGGFNEEYVIMEDYEILDRIESQHIPFQIIPKSVYVSSRKYLKNNYLEVQVANLRAMKMYRRGEDPVRIKDFYTNALS